MKRTILMWLALAISCAPVRALPEPEATKYRVGKIAFHQDINSASVDQAIQFIEQAAKNGLDVIVIELNSPGGEVDSGFDFAKAIEDAPVPVVCVVDGQADSMAFYILQSCPIRLMTKRSLLMVHEARLGAPPSLDPLVNANRQSLLRAINFAMAEHVSRRMCIDTDKLLQSIQNHDWWMTWKEAFATGSVDGTVKSTQDVIQWYSWFLDKPMFAEPAPACQSKPAN